MKWAVAFIGDDNKERLTVFSSDQCYFLMTVCVRWYSPDLNVSDIKRLRFYAARPVFYDENDRPLPNRFLNLFCSGIYYTVVDLLSSHKGGVRSPVSGGR